MTDGPPTGRTTSAAGQLARLGVTGAVALAEAMAGEPWWHDDLLDPLAAAADPQLALRTAVDMAAEHAPLLPEIVAEPAAWRAFVLVSGASLEFSRDLVRHPEHLRVFGDDPAAGAIGERLRAAAGAPRPGSPEAGWPAADRLRVAYREELLRIAIADLARGASFEEVTAMLSELADGVLEAALDIATAGLPPSAAPARLAIVALGKCGGRELNYISDVDVIFVAEATDSDPNDAAQAAALRTATTLASEVIKICGGSSPEGSIWQVDPGLRPEGKAGALVRTLHSHLAYYQKWAKTWEFQALLKARPAAGDRTLAEAYCHAVAPLVWEAADRPGFVAEVQAMRQRVERTVPTKQADRQLKLGKGGLRDVEFSVQLLQLVHGRGDVMLRSPNTLGALEALAQWGYVGREDAASLASAYRFLRTLEHRIQMRRMQRSHVVPSDPEELRILARAMGVDTADELTAAWRARGREVRRIHEKLFYRPLLDAVARIPGDQARLTPEKAATRLDALGFRDPQGALRHIEALTVGVSRRAAIQRTLLPVMLGWFADAPDPDAGLLGFRRVSDVLGSTPWYLRLLRDESAAAERLAKVLASSRYASELLLRAPDGVAMLGDPQELRPRQSEALIREFLSTAARHPDAATAVRGVRALRRRELFRISATDVLGGLTVDEVGSALTDVADATIAGALAASIRAVEDQRGQPLPTRFLIVGMGRFGGGELGYGSDADVMYVHDPLPGADEQAAGAAALAVANELRTLLNATSADPPVELDAGLRPEGKAGPLVRTLASYAGYYQRWRSFWEAQALLRAERVAGDEQVWAGLRRVIDPIRWPQGGTSPEMVREIRRLKARMENERLPRGADPTLHTKLGRGGLSDVEWAIQLLQLGHAHSQPELRTSRTLHAIAAARRSGLLSPADADTLTDGWRMATRIRNVVMLVSGRASDLVPSQAAELIPVSRVLGYAPGESYQLLEDYRRTTRRARVVAERVIYGEA
ncbi:MAG: bifunctional [glutamine synthetase] adenylyltransferase/[glutamine synthetase]-adenylyl-L-tyrosine phosphorylase [Candidatus Nanopelagicales bacterium]